MPKIDFNQAQKALGHLQHNGQGEKPTLLNVKGWDKSKKLYQLKSDIKETFKPEIDRFKDLLKERQDLYQKKEKAEQFPTFDDKVKEINDEIEELFKQEKEFELSGEKLSENEFGDVIDAGIFMDLEFAIKINESDG